MCVILCRQRCFEHSVILATAQWTPPQYFKSATNSSSILATAQWIPPWYWKLHDDACSNVETSANTLASPQREWGAEFLSKSLQTKCRLSLRTMNFRSRIGNLFPKTRQLYEMVLHHWRAVTAWGRADFSKNLRASLFNDDLSKQPNF